MTVARQLEGRLRNLFFYSRIVEMLVTQKTVVLPFSVFVALSILPEIQRISFRFRQFGFYLIIGNLNVTFLFLRFRPYFENSRTRRCLLILFLES